jgi:hypothetical protein
MLGHEQPKDNLEILETFFLSLSYFILQRQTIERKAGDPSMLRGQLFKAANGSIFDFGQSAGGHRAPWWIDEHNALRPDMHEAAHGGSHRVDSQWVIANGRFLGQ